MQPVNRKVWIFWYLCIALLATASCTGCLILAGSAKAEISDPVILNPSQNAAARGLIPPGAEHGRYETVEAYCKATYPCPPGQPEAPTIVLPAPPAESKRNRIMLLGGYGPDGLAVGVKPGKTNVEPFYGPMVGLGYQRVVFDDFSLGLFGLSGTSTLSRTFVGAVAVGWDW